MSYTGWNNNNLFCSPELDTTGFYEQTSAVVSSYGSSQPVGLTESSQRQSAVNSNLSAGPATPVSPARNNTVPEVIVLGDDDGDSGDTYTIHQQGTGIWQKVVKHRSGDPWKTKIYVSGPNASVDVGKRKGDEYRNWDVLDMWGCRDYYTLQSISWEPPRKGMWFVFNPDFHGRTPDRLRQENGYWRYPDRPTWQYDYRRRRFVPLVEMAVYIKPESSPVKPQEPKQLKRSHKRKRTNEEEAAPALGGRKQKRQLRANQKEAQERLRAGKHKWNAEDQPSTSATSDSYNEDENTLAPLISRSPSSAFLSGGNPFSRHEARPAEPAEPAEPVDEAGETLDERVAREMLESMLAEDEDEAVAAAELEIVGEDPEETTPAPVSHRMPVSLASIANAPEEVIFEYTLDELAECHAEMDQPVEEASEYTPQPAEESEESEEE